MPTHVHKKVLIVDDNVDQARPLALLLRHSGYDADYFTTGESALAWLSAPPPGIEPGLLIVDLTMPGMSGLEVLRSVRTNPRTQTIPVVIHSACSDEEGIHRARSEGANDYWMKVAMRMEEIRRRIEHYVTPQPNPPASGTITAPATAPDAPIH